MSWSIADTAQSIPERFAQQALRNPTKTAIDGTAWQPTFAELDAAANRLARTLLERGVTADARVALLLRHDAPLILALLATLKAGAAAVVLNASDPPARLAQLRADTMPSLLVTDTANRALALSAGFPTGMLVMASRLPDASPHPAPVVEIDPDDVALLICTSGSTGRPVAVMQTHRNILHNVLRHTNGLGLRGDDRIVLLASPSGGQGAGTVWAALLNGATLCPFAVVERGLTGFSDWLAQTRITVLVASASLFRSFLATLDGTRPSENLHEIRLVRLGSEQALRSDYEAWRRHFSPECLFANTYSSTETGSITHHLMSAQAEPESVVPRGVQPEGPAEPAGAWPHHAGAHGEIANARLPAGLPGQDVELVLIGEDGAELPPGHTGEIVVRSRFVSPGYWREQELTARRFAGGRDGVRQFRTGDLGHRSRDGLLTVLGRSDDVVKIRGNRVSLAEVEVALAQGTGVAAAVVLTSSSARGDTRLTAYIVPVPEGPDSAPTPASLRRELRAKLPEHAVPSELMFLDDLPLTPHGKVDRRRLARRAEPAPGRSFGAPLGETEELIAGLCARVLGREEIGRGEDFFDLGADSLALAEIAVGVQRALGVEIGLRAFAASPTVAALAQIAERLRAEAGGEPEPPLTRALRIGPLPASFAQERIYRQCATPRAAAGYVIAASHRIDGPLDVEALRWGIEQVVNRHEVLRTTYTQRYGRLLQVVHPPAPVEPALLDVSRAADPAAAAAALLRDAAPDTLDLEHGPLVRFTLVCLGADEHRLHRVNHHINSDGWSWEVFLRELAGAYEAALAGEPRPRLDELALQYGDVAAWERERLRRGGRRHRELLARWRTLARTGAGKPAPFARPTPVGAAAPAQGTISWGLEPAVTHGLQRLGREAGATPYMVRLAIFAALLSAETGEREVILGTYMTTRRQPETWALFGCFTHLALLRLHCAGDPTLGEWLARVRGAVLEAGERSELPYETAAEELAGMGEALPGFQALFAGKEAHRTLRFAGLQLGPPEHSIGHYMPSGFSFMVDPARELDGCRTDFDATIYDPVRVRAFVERYRRLAFELCGASLDRPLRELVRRSDGRSSASAHGER